VDVFIKIETRPSFILGRKWYVAGGLCREASSMTGCTQWINSRIASMHIVKRDGGDAAPVSNPGKLVEVGSDCLL
jgi:hypothetical protein